MHGIGFAWHLALAFHKRGREGRISDRQDFKKLKIPKAGVHTFILFFNNFYRQKFG
jgi:hypothetical protein